MVNEKEKLLDWCLKNIHSNNWRLIMITKTFENEIKKLTSEQIKSIELFMKLIDKYKGYFGGEAVIRINDIDEVFKTIKKLIK